VTLLGGKHISPIKDLTGLGKWGTAPGTLHFSSAVLKNATELSSPQIALILREIRHAKDAPESKLANDVVVHNTLAPCDQNRLF
jgi:hypothetical protein